MERISNGHAGIGVRSFQVNLAVNGQILLTEWRNTILCGDFAAGCEIDEKVQNHK